MIRHAPGLRLDSSRPVRDQIHEACGWRRGVVLEAIGDLSPLRLSETGRRELRHLLRTMELSLVALSLPTRRSFDTTDQLDDRIRRADLAFALAYELGTNLVLARVGQVPPEDDPERREAFTNAISALGQRADHRGVRLALETGSEPGQRLKTFLDSLDLVSLAASIDPASLLRGGIDPVAASRELSTRVAHAYAGDATGSAGGAAPNPRGLGFPAGALDWEEYLGALEEIGYPRLPHRLAPSLGGSARSVHHAGSPVQTVRLRKAVGGNVRREAWSVTSLLGFNDHYSLVRAGPPDRPFLCDRRSPRPRPLAGQLETSGRPKGDCSLSTTFSGAAAAAVDAVRRAG